LAIACGQPRSTLGSDYFWQVAFSDATLGPWNPRKRMIQTRTSTTEVSNNKLCNLTGSNETVNCVTESEAFVDESLKPHGFMVTNMGPSKLGFDNLLNTVGKEVTPQLWTEVTAPASMDRKDGLPLSTVVVRQIPRYYSMQTLLFEFMALSYAKSIDFLYLPEDKKGGKNRGYAFVNLTSAEIAVAFKETMDGHTWQHVNQQEPIQQPAAASWALVQGFAANNAKHPMAMALLISPDSLPTAAPASWDLPMPFAAGAARGPKPPGA